MVSLEILSQVGQVVAELVNQQQTAGTYQVQWNAAGMPAGIYFYRLEVGSRFSTGKMVVEK